MGGNMKKAKGRIKQAAGALTGNDELQRDGKRDERVGSLKNTTDDVTEAVHDKVDETLENVADKD